MKNQATTILMVSVLLASLGINYTVYGSASMLSSNATPLPTNTPRGSSLENYTENAVWIQDADWVSMNKNILTTNLSKLTSDLANNNIKYAFVFVGYWNAATNNINYDRSDAVFTAAINALHAVNVKALAWAEDGGGGTMDITPQNRNNIYNAIIACMKKGFDGYNDDIESFTGTHQDQIEYLNGLTPILNGLGKLNMPDVAFDWQQNTNQYLHVDSIVSMFYSSNSTFEDPQAAAYWQEEFGVYHNNQTPASPVILGIMNYYGNTYPLAWQLAQAGLYMATYPHANLKGFSLWLYEYVGTHADDWAQWNYWINRIGTNSTPTLYSLKLNSEPTGTEMIYQGDQKKTPTTEYTFDIPQSITAISQFSVETQQSINGVTTKEYVFTHWQDGSTNPTITISSFDANTTVTAYYDISTQQNLSPTQMPLNTPVATTASLSPTQMPLNTPVATTASLSPTQTPSYTPAETTAPPVNVPQDLLVSTVAVVAIAALVTSFYYNKAKKNRKKAN